jgi:hypothetical protein
MGLKTRIFSLFDNVNFEIEIGEYDHRVFHQKLPSYVN